MIDCWCLITFWRIYPDLLSGYLVFTADPRLERILLRVGDWAKCSAELPARKHFYICNFFLSQNHWELYLAVSYQLCQVSCLWRGNQTSTPCLTGTWGGGECLPHGMKMKTGCQRTTLWHSFAFGGALCEENNSSLSCSAQGPPVMNVNELFLSLGKRWFAIWETAGAFLSSCPKSNPYMTWNKVEEILLCGLKCKSVGENKSDFKAKSATHPLWILESSFRPPGGRGLWNARDVSIKLLVWFACKDYLRQLRPKRIQLFLFLWDLH